MVVCGAEHMQIRVVRGDASDEMFALYEKSFEGFDDNEDENGNETHALPCTQRATSHLGMYLRHSYYGGNL